MAKKKIKSIEDIYSDIIELINRMKLNSAEYNDNIISMKNIDGNSTFFDVSNDIIDLFITGNFEIQKNETINISKYTSCDVNEWVEIKIDTDITKGKIININIDGNDHGIQINRDAFPIKMKKSESNNLFYRVYVNKNDNALILKKNISNDVDNGSFDIYKIFKVIQ